MKPSMSETRVSSCVWLHSAQQCTAHQGAAREHGFALNVRCDTEYVFGFGDPRAQRTPVLAQCAIQAGNSGMRRHAQDAPANFTLEAVHHREHGDQHRHTERDSQQRTEADEGNEAVAAARTDIAQTDECREWTKHDD